MNAVSRPFVHGGQGAVAELVASPPPIMAVARPRWRTIRVWQGHGAAVEFTIDEARALCVAGDAALLDGADHGRRASLWVPMGDARARAMQLIVDRLWLREFLAAVRRALRAWDAASDMAKAGRG